MSAGIIIEFHGKIANIKTHCTDLGISYDAVLSRKKETNEPFEEILEYFLNTENKGFKNITCRELVEIDGVKALPKEWCDKLGLNYDSVRKYKARENVSYKEAITHFLEKFCFILNDKRVTPSCYFKYMGYDYAIISYWRKKYNLTWQDALNQYLINGKIERRLVKNERFHRIWAHMKSRCINPKDKSYPRYGGRKPKPIQLYERWYDYFNFEDDMLESYLAWAKIHGEEDTTIDRWPDKLGNYEPNNVRWATQLQQANNKTNTVIIDNVPLGDFSRRHNLPKDTVKYRFKHGWSVDKIINTPIDKEKGKVKYYLPCGVALKQHCIINNYCYSSIIRYINKYNLSPDEALAKYLKRY